MDIKQRKILVIYHKEDNDGACSAGIIINKINEEDDEAIAKDSSVLRSMISPFGVDYAILTNFYNTDDFKHIYDFYDEVYLTDMSFNNIEAMNELYDMSVNAGKKFVYFDHHAPVCAAAMENRFGNAKGWRETTCSAILCAWKYFYGEDNIPHLFEMLSDYDSWQWVNKGYDEDELFSINTGFTIKGKLDPFYWASIANAIRSDRHSDIANEISAAEKIGWETLQRQREHCKEMIKEWGDLSWTIGTHKACALFTQEKFSSRSFISLKDTDIECGIVFKHKPTGDWVISVYNVTDDIDFHIGEYLKSVYSGGGHKGAGGCTVSQDQFIDILTNKSM